MSGKPPDRAAGTSGPAGTAAPAGPAGGRDATNPRRCDVLALARAGGTLQGTVAQAELPRLAAGLAPPEAAAPAPAYAWQARGESRAVRGAPAQTWLHLQASGVARLVCQRCLQVMDVPLAAERSFLFVADEVTAARLDEAIEDDVLVLSRHLDLIELVEDELILTLPLVPRHELCPEALPMRPDEPQAADDEEPHPFAALAALKKRPQPS